MNARSAASGGLLIVCVALFCFTIDWYETDIVGEASPSGSNSNFTLGYGIIIDCGSSGSRIYVYSWKAEYVRGKLLAISENSSWKISPGLSSLDGKSDEQIANYTRALLDHAAVTIPSKQHRETPLFILCTAGMRQLSLSSQERILDSVRSVAKAGYNFEFQNDYAQVISGKQEAVYMWIAVNYLLDQFEETTQRGPNSVCIRGRCRLRTHGMLEMGGASMQIAYELDPTDAEHFLSKDSSANSVTRSHMLEVNLSCTADSPLHYYLYATTYLNYGGDAARDRYNLAFFNKSQDVETLEQKDPCLPDGVTTSKFFSTKDQLPYIKDKPVGSIRNRTLNLIGVGNATACAKRLNASVMQIVCRPCNDSIGWDQCNMTDRCTLEAKWQPIIDFDKLTFYAFSHFYYRWAEIFNQPESYNVSVFREKIKHICESDFKQAMEVYSAYAKRGAFFVRQLQLQCLKSTFMYSMLHDAFKFPTDYSKLKIVRNIKGISPEWALGAILHKSRTVQARYKRFAESGSVSSRSETLLVLILIAFQLIVRLNN